MRKIPKIRGSIISFYKMILKIKSKLAIKAKILLLRLEAVEPNLKINAVKVFAPIRHSDRFGHSPQKVFSKLSSARSVYILCLVRGTLSKTRNFTLQKKTALLQGAKVFAHIWHIFPRF